MGGSTVNSVTILRARNGKKLTKQFSRNANGDTVKANYDSAKWYDAADHQVNNIDELHAVLTDLEPLADMCIIRGRIKTGEDTITDVRRILYDTDGDVAMFEDTARPWMLIDFDNVPAPSWLPEDLRLTYLVDMLPEWFQGVTYHYRWSASAGMDGWQSLSCHMWFWLTVPWKSETIRRRIDVENWDCDASPFDGVHIHYTAAPIFDGITDPIQGKRSGLVRGARDAVDLPPFVEPVQTFEPRTRPMITTTFDQRFQAMLDKIGPNYHQPIRNCIRWYVSNAPEIDQLELQSRLEDAIFYGAAGNSPKSNYNSHYLRRSINGAVRKFS